MELRTAFAFLLIELVLKHPNTTEVPRLAAGLQGPTVVTQQVNWLQIRHGVATLTLLNRNGIGEVEHLCNDLHN